MDSRKYNYGVSKARESLINNPTPSEQLILDYIKFYNLKHIQFQKVIRINPYKSYIADFYNKKTNTIVEIDGLFNAFLKAVIIRTVKLRKEQYKILLEDTLDKLREKGWDLRRLKNILLMNFRWYFIE